MSDGFTGSELFSAIIRDDVSATSVKMASSLKSLSSDVKLLGDAFKKTNADPLVTSLKQARQLFHESAGNAKLFRASLKDAGVSALDTKLLLGKMNQELLQTHRNALGMRGFLNQALNISPHTMERIHTVASVVGTIGKLAGGLAVAGIGAAAYGGELFLKSVVGAAESRQNTMMGMKFMFQEKLGLGEEDAQKRAEEDYRWSQTTARKTSLTTPQITGAMEQNIMAGWGPEESKVLVKWMADTATKFRNDPEAVLKAQNLFSRMGGKTFADRGDLRSMTLAHLGTTRDVTAEAFKMGEFKQVFAGLGASATQEAKELALQAGIRRHLVTGRDLLQAGVNASEAHGTNVGTFAESHGPKSLSGAISNVEQAWGDLIRSTDAANWPGLVAFRDFLNKITEAFNPATESGQKLLMIVKGITDDLFIGLNDLNQQNINQFFLTAANAAKKLSEMARGAWVEVKKFMSGDLSLSDVLVDTLVDVGKAVAQGFRAGITMSSSSYAEERFSKKHGGLSHDELKFEAMRLHQSEDVLATNYESRRASLEASGGSVERDSTISPFHQQSDMWKSVMDFSGVVFDMTKSIEAATEKLTLMADAPLSAVSWDMSNPTQMFDMMEGHVPHYAGGGLVSRPTLALIGESGPEVVVPLGAAQRGFGRGGLGTTVHASVSITAGSGDAAQQWASIRPLLQREVVQMFEGLSAEA